MIEKVHPATSLGIVPENEDGLKLPELNVDTDLKNDNFYHTEIKSPISL